MKHTAGPWEVSYHDANGQRIVSNKHIEICTCWHHCVGSIEKEMEANAAFIVLACNNHDDLIAALSQMVDIWEGPRELAAVKFAAAVVNARAVLARAKEGA